MLMERSLSQGSSDNPNHGDSSTELKVAGLSLAELVRTALENSGLAWLKRNEVLTDPRPHRVNR